MSKTSEKTEAHRGRDELRTSPTMARLLDALQAGTDIGHYGRLTFVMVARHFLDDDEIVELIRSQPGVDEAHAHSLLVQVKARDYNPPKRERILQWQQRQDFPIIADAQDPQAGNVYRELQFPDHIYDNIEEFWEEKIGEGVSSHRHS
jgi:hypothetical protein